MFILGVIAREAPIDIVSDVPLDKIRYFKAISPKIYPDMKIIINIVFDAKTLINQRALVFLIFLDRYTLRAEQ